MAQLKSAKMEVSHFSSIQILWILLLLLVDGLNCLDIKKYMNYHCIFHNQQVMSICFVKQKPSTEFQYIIITLMFGRLFVKYNILFIIINIL